MKFTAFALVASTTVAATLDAWEQYKQDFGKVYVDDADEGQRKQIFEKTVERIAKLNAMGPEAVFGLTWSSDRKSEEKHKTGLKKPDGFVATAPIYEKLQALRSPVSINWRETEAITPIKNQGQCGSCWAFSATEAVESQLALAGGDGYSIELSPQQVTSCTPSTGTYGSFGCQGGFSEGAYEYLKSAPGLANSFYIPYEQSLTASSTTAACPTTKVEALAGPNAALSGGYAKVTGYTYATPACTSGACDKQDLNKLAAALEETPVSVCVNAGAWNDYTTGVMSSSQCGSMAADEQDHCVMATGFNLTAPTPYWIVRNSWSSTWGEKGYIYLEYSQNTCGLADDATIPTVSLGLSEAQEAKAAEGRERMYMQATRQAFTNLVV
jgi:C1A family cysteine protease